MALVLFLCYSFSLSLSHTHVHLTRSLFRNNFLTFSRSFIFLLLLFSIAPVVKRLNSSLFTSGSHAKLHCNKNETKAPKMAWNANLCTAPLYRIHVYVHGNWYDCAILKRKTKTYRIHLSQLRRSYVMKCGGNCLRRILFCFSSRQRLFKVISISCYRIRKGSEWTNERTNQRKRNAYNISNCLWCLPSICSFFVELCACGSVHLIPFELIWCAVVS